MKASAVRWAAAALMLLCLAPLVFAPAMAEETAVLPMEFTEGGKPTKPENWTYEEKVPAAYHDSTIDMTAEHGSVTLKIKNKKVKHEFFVVRVRIADPTQLRTAASRDTYTGRGQAKADSMAASKNAVVATNGDFFKYEYDVGYVVRQGELVRDATDNRRKRLFDMLLIDNLGDFHIVPSATTESINAFVEQELTPNGLTILDTFNLGPALILNGEIQDVSQSEAARQGSYQWMYPQQRICIVQTGKLEYAIVEVYGKTDSSAGMTLQQFAQFVAEKCPDAIIAYNLDGGGSTNLIIDGKRVCKTPGIREVTDILYFASAEE